MLIYKIARRFLFSACSHSVVNLVAAVSTVAVMVPVMAMVVILSLHNGLQSYIEKMYGQFDSSLRIEKTEGQFFDVDSAKIEQLGSIGIASRVLQSGVLLEWGGRQYVATIRGVDSMYADVVPIKGRIEQGRWELYKGDLPRAVIGAGVGYALGMSIAIDEPIYVYTLVPMPSMLSMLPIPLYKSEPIYAAGVFALDEATDAKYIFAPLKFVENLIGSNGQLSSIEVKIDDNISPKEAKARAQEIFGSEFTIRTQHEQRETIFKVINSEKWLIYALLSLVVMIASLSLAGCTLMMISEKRDQSATLSAMGLSGNKLRAVFTSLGMMIVGIGIVTGIALGTAISLVQQHFGIIKMAGESFLMEAYPVKVQITDLGLVAIGVGVIGYVIVRIAASSATKGQKK